MRRNWISAYLLLVALWGGSYAVTDIALTGLAPSGVVMWRSIIGAAFLAVLLFISGRGLPRLGRADILRICLLGALTTGGQLSCSIAQTRLPSGLVAVLCSMTPLISVVIFWLRRTPIPPLKWLCLCLSVAGVAVLLSPEVRLDNVGITLGLLTAVLFSMAGVLSADFFPDSTFTGTQLTVAQLVVTAALMAPINLLTSTDRQFPPKAGPLVAVLALGVLAAGVGNALFWRVLRSAGPVFTGTTHQLVPVVAVIFGVAVLDEPLGLGEVIGAGLVFAGLALLLPLVRVAGNQTEDPRLEESLIGVHCEEPCNCGNLEAVRREHTERMQLRPATS